MKKILLKHENIVKKLKDLKGNNKLPDKKNEKITVED